MAFDYPAYGQQRACNELRKKGIFISAGGIRSVWLRHNLELFEKRLQNLEERMAKESMIRDTWEARTPITLGISKASAAFISRLLLIPIAVLLLRSSMKASMRLLLLTS